MAASLALLLAFSVSGTLRSGAHAIVDHFAEGGGDARVSEKVRAIVERTDQQAQNDAADDDPDAESESDSDLEAVPPEQSKAPAPHIRLQFGEAAAALLPPTDAHAPAFSGTARNVPAGGGPHHIDR